MYDCPHIMVLNSEAVNKIHPTGEHPDATEPYVMYRDTPYAHLIIPVK